jgi:dUTP pyrophosphatase
MLKVKLLNDHATVPTVNTPGEDLAYDLYASEDAVLFSNKPTKVPTGVALEFRHGFGGLMRDRSSMAAKGITVSAGVIDAGYRGEVNVLLTLNLPSAPGFFLGADYAKEYKIKRGEKVAQIIPVRVYTGSVEVVAELSGSARGARGWGSSGK